MTNRITEQSKERLEASRAPIDEVLSSLRHDLKTPLNSVLGFSQVLLQGSAGELNERQQRYLQNIRQGGENLLSLLDALLDVAGAADSDEVSIPFNSRHKLDGLQGLLNGSGYKRGVEVTIQIEAETVLRGNPTEFRRHVFQILFGLIRSSDEGSSVVMRSEDIDEVLHLSFESRNQESETALPAYVATSARVLAEAFAGKLETRSSANERILRLALPAYGVAEFVNNSVLSAAS
ncbi:MAG: histidine kinase dimerization/phospho-acceptor domain-containing protein [Planctomycetota bacterium]|jgi:signal transduction histidine kinase|nr:histidine kinase dimerization/phospho-acceptor domain-containing protein [Planctomycetota bacterium]MDP7133128.1 histidine kinase dimerization/phospho-acceptor domain-containing protein [Planctomycetota bacterium]MDP7254529.1 histidine kinase dimerization/phospho-acceptor domain-containing protein [Planctomycetota bacterium]